MYKGVGAISLPTFFQMNTYRTHSRRVVRGGSEEARGGQITPNTLLLAPLVSTIYLHLCTADTQMDSQQSQTNEPQSNFFKQPLNDLTLVSLSICFNWKRFPSVRAGKSFSEVLTYSKFLHQLTLPQYDKRLSIEIWITSSVHENSKLRTLGTCCVSTQIVLNVKTKTKKQFV